MINIINKVSEYNQGVSCEIGAIPIVLDFIEYCQMNHCGRYNKSWSCPPAIDSDFKKISSRFNKAYVINKVFQIADEFDIEGMDKALEQNNDMVYTIIKQLRANQIGFYLLKAGSCNLCSKCTYPDSPCVFPNMLYPPIEAFGIDVTALASKLNMKYYNGKNTITYFTIILYTQKE